MSRIVLKRSGLGGGIALCLCMSLTGCSAQQEREPGLPALKRDFYGQNAVTVSARRSREQLGGDFDGDTTLVGPDVIFVPEAGSGGGRGYALGVLQDGQALELEYREVDYGGLRYRSAGFNVMRYFNAGKPLQPHYVLGVFVPWLQLEDASVDAGRVGDADITGGIGLQTGLGVSYYLDARVSLDLRGHISWQTFSRAKGVAGDSEDLDESLGGLSWSLSLGVTFGLIPLR